jgi:hypothetical protein
MRLSSRALWVALMAVVVIVLAMLALFGLYALRGSLRRLMDW